MAKMLFYFFQSILLLSIGVSDIKNLPIRLNDIQSSAMLYQDEQKEHYYKIPTVQTHVNLEVIGMTLEATMDQIFTHSGDQPIEAIYVFPLPEEAAVTSMQMLIGDRLIESNIKEKEEAKHIYEKAKTEGKRASLTEQERPNIFTHSVANILPGDTIVIRLKFVDIIQYKDGEFQLRFPTVVGPRYIPGHSIKGYSGSGWAYDTDQVPDASRITPPVIPNDQKTGNKVSLSVHVNMGLPIESISSSSHEILVNPLGPGESKVTLNNNYVIPNRDFLLTFSLKNELKPKAAFFSTQKGDEHYFMLMAVPQNQQSGTPFPKDVIFIVDVSGSMDGESIIQAKKGLSTAIQSLRRSDSFNIIAFNDSYHSFSPNSILATDHNKATAHQFIQRLHASGGTEVLCALEEGLTQSNQSSSVPMIFLLTDGSVGNESTILKSIKSHLGKTRLFPIGIGSAPNSFLLKKIAELGRGTFTYISSPKDVTSKIERLYRKIENPVITNIHLELGDSAEIVPNIIPDLFQGEPLLVFGKLFNPLNKFISFSGHTPAGILQLEFPLSFNQEKDYTAISTLWGRKKISGLMNDYRLGDTSKKSDIIDIALEHHLITKFTSFVAVENKIVNPRSLLSQAIPVDLPKGWKYDSIFGRKHRHKLKLASRDIHLPIRQRNMSLPQTATSFPLQLLIGIFLTITGMIFKRVFHV